MDTRKNKTCTNCGKAFIPANGRQKYCTRKCAQSQYAKTWYEKNRKVKVAERKCPECGTGFIPNTHNHKLCSLKCKNDRKLKLRRLAVEKRESIPEKCKQCGVYFVKKDGRQKYCSRECRCRWNNENKSREFLAKKDLKRYHTMMGNGHYDRSINVKSLVGRAGLKCSICGEFANMDDHYFKNGTFIAGENYPSVDHILPISKGGTHTWDNVQLAHRKCNTKKKDNLSYKTKNGQLKFSI